MTKHPLVSGIGFILTGLGGIFAAPTLYLRTNRALQLLGILVLVAAAVIWAYTGYKAFWDHPVMFSTWFPK